MGKKIAEEIQEHLREIEKFVENSKTPRELINLRRRKVERLGGDVKKHHVPFKRMMHLKEKRKSERSTKKERMEAVGISYKRRRR